MPIDDLTRRKLILLKEERRLSNKDLGCLINNVSGQMVGRWIVDKEAAISKDNEETIKHLVREIDLGVQGIKNTQDLRQVIFSSSMKKGLSFQEISDKMGDVISPDELEILLSEKGADFTPKTLSVLCAVLDLKKDNLPISQESQDLLFINAIKAEMLLTSVNVTSREFISKLDRDLNLDFNILINNLSKNNNEYLVASLHKRDNKFFGLKIDYDDQKNKLMSGDILIVSNEEVHNNDLALFKIGIDVHIGIYNTKNKSINSMGSHISLYDNGSFGDTFENYTLSGKIVKVIRDLE